jgi:hypothetical protein
MRAFGAVGGLIGAHAAVSAEVDGHNSSTGAAGIDGRGAMGAWGAAGTRMIRKHQRQPRLSDNAAGVAAAELWDEELIAAGLADDGAGCGQPPEAPASAVAVGEEEEVPRRGGCTAGSHRNKRTRGGDSGTNGMPASDVEDDLDAFTAAAEAAEAVQRHPRQPKYVQAILDSEPQAVDVNEAIAADVADDGVACKLGGDGPAGTADDATKPRHARTKVASWQFGSKQQQKPRKADQHRAQQPSCVQSDEKPTDDDHSDSGDITNNGCSTDVDDETEDQQDVQQQPEMLKLVRFSTEGSANIMDCHRVENLPPAANISHTSRQTSKYAICYEMMSNKAELAEVTTCVGNLYTGLKHAPCSVMLMAVIAAAVRRSAAALPRNARTGGSTTGQTANHAAAATTTKFSSNRPGGQVTN